MQKEMRTMEIRAVTEPDDNRMIVEGYAIRFDSPATHEIMGQSFTEVIEPRALENTDMSDVPFKYNHSDTVMIMARTRNKTLELVRDEQGLFIRADLANTTSGRDLYELIKRGDIDKMSFAFTVDENGDTYDRSSKTRTITSIRKLFDVAAVDQPFYNTTSISARSYFEMEIERERKALENAELLRIAKLHYFKSKGAKSC